MSSFSSQPVGPGVSVAPQLDPSSMSAVFEAGFKSVINNRPDHEGGPDQPTSAEMEQAARSAGLAYAHLPVRPAFQTAEEIDAFARLLKEMPAPVLAFCRSGTRSGHLYRAATSV